MIAYRGIIRETKISKIMAAVRRHPRAAEAIAEVQGYGPRRPACAQDDFSGCCHPERSRRVFQH